MKSLRGLLLLAFVCFASMAYAQEIDESEWNKHSVRPVRNADIMFKRTIWYRVNLTDKINQPFFAKNRWLPKLMIDAVKSSLLRPYENDSLKKRLTIDEFKERIKRPNEGGGDSGGDDWGGGGDDWGGGGGWGDSGDSGWGDTGGGGGGAVAEANDELYPEDIYLMDVKVDILFDRRRGKWVHDIQVITLVLPAENNGGTLERMVASFSYKEVVENLFKENRDALWYNDRNLAESKNLSDAFDLLLYQGKITKYTNTQDKDIALLYGDAKGDIALMKGLEYKYDLVEYESDLWSN